MTTAITRLAPWMLLPVTPATRRTVLAIETGTRGSFSLALAPLRPIVSRP